jgi:membrane-bound ClpP family serine protease
VAWDARGEDGANAAPTSSQAPAVPADRQASKVVIITIHEQIDDVMLQSIERRLTLAERGGADAVVFDINTPGGEVGAVVEICDRIKKSSVKNTIAWVNTEAISGGAIIAMACHEIVFNDPGHLGDAMPIMIEQMTGRVKTASQEELQRKILPILLGNLLDSVRRHNESVGRYDWDEFLAQAMVVNDLQLWWVRNKDSGVFVGVDRREAEMLFPGQSLDGQARLVGGQAPSTAAAQQGTFSTTPPTGGPIALPIGSSKLAGLSPDAIAGQMGSTALSTMRPVITAADAGKYDLIGRINDGSSAVYLAASDAAQFNLAANSKRTGNTATIEPIKNDEDLKKFLGAKHLSRVDKSWSEGLVVFLTNPIVRAVFFIIFIVTLFVELSHPGVTLPGVVAVVSLLLVLVPSALIGMAGWWTIVAIFAGLVLIAMEVFVLPGLGAAGIAGALLLFAGLVGSFLGSGGLFPDTDAERTSRLWGVSTLLGGMFTAGVAIYFLAKHLESLPFLNRLVLSNSSGGDEEEGMLEAMEGSTSVLARVGEVGVAITPLRPAGKIEVGDRVLDAVAEFGFVMPGSKVRVVAASEFRVSVEEIREDAKA